MEVLISRDSKEHKGYAEDDARKALASGKLQATDLAWHEGMDDWEPLALVLDRLTRLHQAIEEMGYTRRVRSKTTSFGSRMGYALRNIIMFPIKLVVMLLKLVLYIATLVLIWCALVLAAHYFFVPDTFRTVFKVLCWIPLLPIILLLSVLGGNFERANSNQLQRPISWSEEQWRIREAERIRLEERTRYRRMNH